MSGIMKFFRLRRIRKQAAYIARYGGWQTDDGYSFDDDRLRIISSPDMITVHYLNEYGDVKTVYSYEFKKRESIYHAGNWEKIIDARYKITKNTAR